MITTMLTQHCYAVAPCYCYAVAPCCYAAVGARHHLVLGDDHLVLVFGEIVTMNSDPKTLEGFDDPRPSLRKWREKGLDFVVKFIMIDVFC